MRLTNDPTPAAFVAVWFLMLCVGIGFWGFVLYLALRLVRAVES